MYVDGFPLEDKPPPKVRLQFNLDKSFREERVQILGRMAEVALAPFSPSRQLFLHRSGATSSDDFKPVAMASANNEHGAALRLFPDWSLSRKAAGCQNVFLSSI